MFWVLASMVSLAILGVLIAVVQMLERVTVPEKSASAGGDGNQVRHHDIAKTGQAEHPGGAPARRFLL
jgi:hypothetical protein